MRTKRGRHDVRLFVNSLSRGQILAINIVNKTKNNIDICRWIIRELVESRESGQGANRKRVLKKCGIKYDVQHVERKQGNSGNPGRQY